MSRQRAAIVEESDTNRIAIPAECRELPQTGGRTTDSAFAGPTLTYTTIPEPSAGILTLLGIGALFTGRRGRRG